MALLKAVRETRIRFHPLRGMIALLLFLSGTQTLPAETTTSPEFQVKAAYLYNFAQFVDWPARAFADPQAPVVIGILGDDLFGSYLDELVRGEKVNNRPIVVQRYHRLNEVRICHVLFISRSETSRLDEIVSALKGRNILSVSDSEDFLQRGGMIQFANEKNKIRMRINLGEVRSANLKISSKLLRVAEVKD
jgi:hypothetical protein